jgi:hypothetical protein
MGTPAAQRVVAVMGHGIACAMQKNPSRYADRIGAVTILAALALPFAALPFAALRAQPVPDAFTVVESGARFATLQDAVNAVGNARATIRIAPGTYRQCAVQQQGVVVYEAAEPGTVIFAGRACEGKAALVLRGTGAEVRGLTFTNINVADGNGAGIRLEQGALNVAHARFENSQQGILTADDPNGRIYITRSTFSGLGTCENSAGCAHSLADRAREPVRARHRRALPQGAQRAGDDRGQQLRRCERAHHQLHDRSACRQRRPDRR